MSKKVILGTIPSDSHCWNLLFIQLYLEERGCDVVNLGPCTCQEIIAKTSHKIQPDFIVISTVNGLGSLEAPNVARYIKSHDFLKKTPLYLGGKLTIDGILSAENKKNLIEAGFSKVFYGSSALQEFDLLLHSPKNISFHTK